ncbi:MAG: bifunctional oligoribonuclease/PAP phosphatase NrnA [Chloroflexota bacterium]|nr:bifunctional oligoribonuclease/PAP phosphatase NrnA [Anaerolineae bacterium]
MKANSIDQIEMLIRNAGSVWIGCHIFPDGDAIGSTLGLMWGLRQLGKKCVPACQDPVPSQFSFLSGVLEFTARAPGDEDLIIVLDCGSLDRIGSLYDPTRFERSPVINIDHHITNTSFGDVNLVQDKSATVEIVYAFLLRLGAEITKDIATCLLSGLSTDTRSFRTSNTTVDTLRVATALMEAGADLAEISHQIYDHMPFSTAGFFGRALGVAKLRGRIAWTEITKAMMREMNVAQAGARGVVSFLASTREADVGIVFRENGHGKIDVEMRSVPGVDVSQVALSFGGGGHPQAAGCSLPGEIKEIEERVLAAMEESLGKQ